MSSPASPLFAFDSPARSYPGGAFNSHSSHLVHPHPHAHTRSTSNPRPLPTPPVHAQQHQPWRHTLSQESPPVHSRTPSASSAYAHPVKRSAHASDKPINWARPLPSIQQVPQPPQAPRDSLPPRQTSLEIGPAVIFGHSAQRNRRLQRGSAYQTPTLPSALFDDVGSPQTPASPVTPGTPGMTSFSQAGTRTTFGAGPAISSWSVSRDSHMSTGGMSGLGLGELEHKWDEGDGSALADFLEEDGYYSSRRDSIMSIEGHEVLAEPSAASNVDHKVEQRPLTPFNVHKELEASDETPVLEPCTPPARTAPPIPLPPTPKVAGKQVATVTRDSVGSLASLAGIHAIAAPTPVDARLSLLGRRGASVLLPSPQTTPLIGSSPSPDSMQSDVSSAITGWTSASASSAAPSSQPLSPSLSQSKKIKRKAVPTLGDVVRSDSSQLTHTHSISTSSWASITPPPQSAETAASPIPLNLSELPSKPMHVLETIPPPSSQPTTPIVASTPTPESSAPVTPRKRPYATSSTKSKASLSPAAKSDSDSETESDGMPVTPNGPDGLAQQMQASLNLRLAEKGEKDEDGTWVKVPGAKGKEKKVPNKISRFFRKPVEA